MEYKNLALFERVRLGGFEGVQMEKDNKDTGTYNGQWKHDKRHGQGTMTWSD
jgi:hypothetical protein